MLDVKERDVSQVNELSFPGWRGNKRHITAFAAAACEAADASQGRRTGRHARPLLITLSSASPQLRVPGPLHAIKGHYIRNLHDGSVILPRVPHRHLQGLLRVLFCSQGRAGPLEDSVVLLARLCPEAPKRLGVYYEQEKTY